MDQADVLSSSAASDDACQPLLASEPKPRPPSPLLRLAPELRFIIYHDLFSNLRVTIHRRAGSEREHLCAIIRTCRLCYAEALTIFYESVTVILKHEAFLYVLRRRIGQHNMVRIRSLVVGGFDAAVGSSLALQLPGSLQKLYIEWRGGTESFHGKPPGRVPDSHIRYLLNGKRPCLKFCVKELWTKNPNLGIWLDTIVGCAPPDKLRNYYDNYHRQEENERYAIVRVQILRDPDSDEWSWGEIVRLEDRSMAEEAG